MNIKIIAANGSNEVQPIQAQQLLQLRTKFNETTCQPPPTPFPSSSSSHLPAVSSSSSSLASKQW